MPAPPLSAAKQQAIADCAAAGMTKAATARKLKVSPNSVLAYWPAPATTDRAATPPEVPDRPGYIPWIDPNPARTVVPHLPDPAPEAGGPSLPDPVPLSYDPFVIDTPGAWGVLCDPHLPYHDKRTIESFVAECRHRGVVGILINGDFLDCETVSRHETEPDRPRLKDEIDKGRQCLEWLRSKFPRARLVYKEGNHDYRVRSYIAQHAPGLWNVPGCDLPSMLNLAGFGVEWVDDQRKVNVGRLQVYHGHEFGGSGGGKHPAEWLFRQTLSTAMCAHFHRTNEFNEPSTDGTLHATWSVGCACYLHPDYRKNNKWNHGFAVVELHDTSRGHFTVTNRRLLPDGRVV